MIRVDTFEPKEIFTLLQQAVEVERTSLNHNGLADYFWLAADGHTVQVERKQWGEVLSDLDAVEEQLRRELPAADETYLLIEGVAEPTLHGIDAYRKSDSKPYFVHLRSYGSPQHSRPGYYHQVMAWLWGLDKAGITPVFSSGIGATVRTLVAYYKEGQKSDHTVLTRYIKPRMTPGKYSTPVLILMGVPDLGEARALTLANHFGSAGRVANATPEEISALPGFGKVMANKVLNYLWEV